VVPLVEYISEWLLVIVIDADAGLARRGLGLGETAASVKTGERRAARLVLVRERAALRAPPTSALQLHDHVHARAQAGKLPRVLSMMIGSDGAASGTIQLSQRIISPGPDNRTHIPDT
jgi:hypothetical protein